MTNFPKQKNEKTDMKKRTRKTIDYNYFFTTRQPSEQCGELISGKSAWSVWEMKEIPVIPSSQTEVVRIRFSSIHWTIPVPFVQFGCPVSNFAVHLAHSSIIFMSVVLFGKNSETFAVGLGGGGGVNVKGGELGWGVKRGVLGGFSTRKTTKHPLYSLL